MHMKKNLFLLSLLLATASTAFAGTAMASKKVVLPPDSCRFHANEWQVDVYAVGAVGTFQGSPSNSIGGNLGVGYFFTQYLGLEVDNSVSGYGSPSSVKASDRLQADLLFRYPICAWNLAPYAMVGGGASWDTATQGNGNVGGGLDYRLSDHVGLFADCRWLYGNSASGVLSSAMPRVGVRFIF